MNVIVLVIIIVLLFGGGGYWGFGYGGPYMGGGIGLLGLLLILFLVFGWR